MYLALLVLLDRSATIIHRASDNNRLGLAVLNVAAGRIAARPEFDGSGFRRASALIDMFDAVGDRDVVRTAGRAAVEPFAWRVAVEQGFAWK